MSIAVKALVKGQETTPLVQRISPPRHDRALLVDGREGCLAARCSSARNCCVNCIEGSMQAAAAIGIFLLFVLGAIFGNDNTCGGILEAEGAVLFEAKTPRYDSVNFEIKGDMYSDITVQEADSWMDKVIRVSIQVQASSEDILSSVLAKTTSRLNTGSIEAAMDVTGIHMRPDACARAKVVISYPRAISSSKELRVVASHGPFKYKVEGRLLTVKNMLVHLKRGSINVVGSVMDSIDLKTDDGHIDSRLLSQGEVKAHVKSGDIKLDIDSREPHKLDVSAHSGSGSARVELRNMIEGHFNVKASFSNAELKILRDTHIYYWANETNRRTGWMSPSGRQPASLPRVDVVSAMEPASLTIW
ncbi:hypothetical protein BGZ73_008985 [Actinomortierella ambigua]|nr:hypothetical protein BGZ73_008985 [Actinomortierella ambigua]